MSVRELKREIELVETALREALSDGLIQESMELKLCLDMLKNSYILELERKVA